MQFQSPIREQYLLIFALTPSFRGEQRQLLALAIPMILSNITAPLLGMVDTAVIGHLSHAYFLGGTAVGNMVITFIIWLCGFLRMSSSGLAAQAYGKQDALQGLQVLVRCLLAAVLLAVGCLLLQQPFIDFSLYLAGGSEQVQFYARQYSEIRIWGLPAAFANLVILGWLLGMHKARVAMWLLIATNLINLLLDLLFVLVLGWQVKGVALASLVAEYSALILGGLFVFEALPLKGNQLKASVKALKVSVFVGISDYFRLNRDILLRTLCLEICFVFMTFQGARLGDAVVAANAILMNFLLLISFGLDGIAYGAEARVGRAQGKNDAQAMQLAVKVALYWSLLFAICYSIFFLALGSQLISLISSIEEVVTLASAYLPWIIALPVLACWCFLFDGVYVGLMQARVMRNSMFVSTFLCFFPCWFLLQSYGNHGLWAAFSVLMLARGLTLAWDYHRRIVIRAN
jgi:MATE family multidrug resistance protein